MRQTRQPTIDRATTLVNEEIDIVAAEREAFAQFLARLHDIPVSKPGAPGSPSGMGPTASVAVGTEPSRELAAVRAAYRETVMAVPHYEREYGGTLAESVATELGDTLAGHVLSGDLLTPAIHNGLVEAATQGRDNRADFLRALRRERESLREIEQALDRIEARVVELDECLSAASTSPHQAEIDESLAALERQCSDLADSRQELIHNRSVRMFSGVAENSLVEYLYAEMETVTPALRDIASRLTDIQTQRERRLD